MRKGWKPYWDGEGRMPDFVGTGGSPIAPFGIMKYLWGNMPALDVLKLNGNEGIQRERDFSLLFAGKSIL